VDNPLDETPSAALAEGPERVLREAVLNRLNELDELARHADAEVLLPLARTELSRLADGWRLLLTVHNPDETGRCRACPRRLRGRRWPCRIWRMAHEHLMDAPIDAKAAKAYWKTPWKTARKTTRSARRERF